MKKILKWTAILLGSMIGLALIGLFVYYLYWASQTKRTYDIDIQTFEIPTDEASIARGEILVEVVRCTECHGKDLSGMLWVNHIASGQFGPSNLTPGENGITNYTDEDYIRSIRHGVGPDGQPLIFMPANYYQDLNQDDLGAIIAYLKTLPPSKTPGPTNKTRPYMWKFVLENPQALPAVKLIDHEQTAVPVGPDPNDKLAYGEYLSLPCRSCHGNDYAGRPMLERIGVRSPNITPYNLGDWTEEDFFRMVRDGILPSERIIPQTFMPWEAIGELSDGEISAIWLYLQSIPPVADEDAIEYQN